ncbi:MAG TPA: hypothetical protein VF240_08840 [Pyrinomonadaceae bacterium]
MQLFRTSTFLRWVLFADAATCIAAGLLLMLGSRVLEQFLGLPAELSRYAGVSLLPFAALLVYLATRENLSSPVVWAVIALNALWTVDSILLLLSGWIEPTGLGSAFIVFQAFGVAMFAALEYLGLRKSAIAAA